MAIGITPGETYQYTLERERELPIPKAPRLGAKSDETPEAFVARQRAAEEAHAALVKRIEEHNETARAAIAAGRVTRWSLRFLSSRHQNRLAQRMIDAKDDGEWVFESVRMGLDGFENYRKRGSGDTIAFAAAPGKVLGVELPLVVTDAVLDSIALRDLQEIGRHILAVHVTEEELGNS